MRAEVDELSSEDAIRASFGPVFAQRPLTMRGSDRIVFIVVETRKARHLGWQTEGVGLFAIPGSTAVRFGCLSYIDVNDEQIELLGLDQVICLLGLFAGVAIGEDVSPCDLSG